MDAAVRDWEFRGNEAEPELAQAAASTRCLALVSVGVDRPAWEVWLAADMSDPVMEPWARRASKLVGDHQTALDNRARAWENGDDDIAQEHDERANELKWEMAQYPLFSTVWMRDVDYWGTRWDALEQLCESWESTGIPSNPWDGFPVPLARLAVVDRLEWPRALYEVDDGVLRRLLVSEVSRELPDGATSDLPQRGRAIAETANAFCADLLPDNPILNVRIAPERDWPFGGAVSWQAREATSLTGPRPFSQFSAGQARWARFSGMLATGIHSGGLVHFEQQDFREPTKPLDEQAPRILLVDEPEMHLHRSAERHMAEGLLRLTRETVDYLFVATHAPDLLNVTGAHLYWLDEGKPKPLTGADLTQLEALGLRPSDLLGITRVILLVEGHQDDLILRLTLGDRLRQSRTYVLPLDGGKELAGAVDSQVLYDFSSAHVVGLLDNISPSLVRRVWNDALHLRIEKGPAAAVRHIKDALPGSVSHENRFMRGWLQKAVTKEGGFPYSRMSPFGLTRRDIIEYLPVEVFVPSAQSWEVLRERHTELMDSGQMRDSQLRDFKAWVAKTYDSDFEDDRIRAAVAQLGSIPEDFIQLAEECERVSTAAPENAGL